MLTITQLLPDLAATGAAPRAAAVIEGTRVRGLEARGLGMRGTGRDMVMGGEGTVTGLADVTAGSYVDSISSAVAPKSAAPKTGTTHDCTWTEIRFQTVPAFHNRWPLCPT